MTSEDITIAYHEATKHQLNRYARSPGHLDWASQPDPFRRFAGAPLVPLPLAGEDASPPYDFLFQPGLIASQPVTASTIGLFFECSLAISAWKEYQGNRWALRCNPSSGNLHPTEGYLIAGPIRGLNDTPAVYHYAPQEHALEVRTSFPLEVWQALHAAFSEHTFFVGLSSIHWREAWKYGERAYRYCQHDVGHAMAAIRIAAAMLGWRAVYLEALSDDDAAALLGLDRPNESHAHETEQPDMLLAICSEKGDMPCSLPLHAITQISHGLWNGHPNLLSAGHIDWAIIDKVSTACRKSERRSAHDTRHALNPTSEEDIPPRGISAYRIIQQRRSALALDRVTGIHRDVFYRMLARVIPALTQSPWDMLAPPIAVHLGLFVHRVEGLPPGLYFLARDSEKLPRLRAVMKPGFLWEKPTACPDALNLYLLKVAQCERAATTVSCGQDIAGDGAFSLGMFAEFEPLIHQHGAWFYRRLFWETGMIGQVLYLEAEAAGIRSTGIGCFFDDPVHDLFGLNGHEFQSLYHFTVGGPVGDSRLTALPPYPNERRPS